MSDDKSEAQKDRQTRLNDALRANLRKRKQQTRARQAPAHEEGREADKTPEASKKDV